MNTIALWNVCYLLVFNSGCLAEPAAEEFPAALARYQQTMGQDSTTTDGEASQPEPPVRAVDGEDVQGDDQYRKLEEQVPDPIQARKYMMEKLQQFQDSPKTSADKKYFENGLAYLDMIDRPQKIELSLADAVRLALDGSYNIRVQSYNPAMAATSVVESEAVFDAIFFSNATFTKNNTPTATTLAATDSTNRRFSTGLRGLLPTGMTVQVAWNVTRQEFDSAFAFATLNPSFRNELAFQVRQPFLRGFGIDFNLSQIHLFQNDRSASEHAFSRSVQDHLLNVEKAYWQLVAARRNLVIESRLIADFQKIYDYLYARKDFDATPVEVNASKSRLDIQIAGYSRVKQNVKDAEDNLKNLLNDPTLNLVDDIEIVPTEFPSWEMIIVDRLAELQSALDSRQELHEAELAIESAKISVGTAKNQALPRFDVSFTYTYDALGKSQHDAFQNLGALDFHNYSVALEFEWPIGNRGARAVLRRAKLQHSQALAALKQTIEGIILEVNVAIREMGTSYEQIGANLTSVESTMDDVDAIEERAERRDPNQLNRELNAQQRLAGARQSLLQSLVDYNMAMSRLERAKGTLLEYNNIVIGDSLSGP